MCFLDPLLLAKFLSRLVLLGTIYLFPHLGNNASLANSGELVNSLKRESVNEGFLNSVDLSNGFEHIELDKFDTQDNILLAQASTNTPPVKPVIAIDYVKITTDYSPIVHNDDWLREGNPLRFEIKTLDQIRPNVELNFKITQSSNYIKGEPTQAIPRFPDRNVPDSGLEFEEVFTLTNENAITTVGWRIERFGSLVEDIGTITIELLPGDDYELDPSNRTLEFRIDGNFTPIMQVLAEDYSIEEGEPARFQIGWNNFTNGGRPPNSSLDVNILVTQQGDFIKGTYPDKVNISNGRTFTTLAIETEDDDQQEANGLVNVALQPGSGYRLISFYTRETVSNTLLDQFDSAYIDVFDNDQPRIAISAVDYTIQEGQTARFKLETETSAPLNNLLIHLKSTTVGDFFFDEISTSIVIPAGVQFGMFEVATINDELAEEDGSITVAIRSGAGYVVALTHFSIVQIEDNDRLRIGVSSLVDSIVEGETIQFDVWSETIVPTADLTVKVSINRTGGNFYNQSLPESIVIPSGRKSIPLNISTINDNNFEVDGEISVEILESTEYLVSKTHVATVNILDNDQSIFIVTHQQSIFEGELVLFFIGPDVQPFTYDRIINIDIDFIGNFIASSAPQEFLLPAGSRSKQLTFTTDISSSVSSDGSVEVELLSGPGYIISDRDSAKVTIKDASKKPPPPPLPTIFISAQSLSITEGETAIFVIGSDQVRLSSQITVNYQVANSGNFLTNSRQNGSFILRNGRFIAGRAGHLLTFGTENDSTDEANGSITITLEADSSYTLLPDYTSATISIADNDESNSTLPIVTIAPLLEDTIVEGEKAQFQISVSQRLQSGLTVYLDYRYNYNYQNFMPRFPIEVVINAGTSSAIFEFDTRTDEEKLPDVTYTFLLESRPHYTIGDPRTATIVANDNDLEEHLPNPDIEETRDPPTISISSNEYFLDETETAKFKITADYGAATDINVSITLTWTDNLYTGFIERRTITLPAGNLEQEFDVNNPYSDEVDAADIYVIGRVQPGEGYLNNWTSTAVSIFADDDVKPKISISAISIAPAMEGDTIQFRLNSPTAPYVNLAVNISLSGAINFLDSSNHNITETLPAGNLTEEFEVATASDQLDESDGNLIATIQPGIGYSIGDNASASVRIQDNDSPNQPIVSIVSNSPSEITEGESASFQLNFSPQTTAEIMVKYNVSGSIYLLSTSLGNDFEPIAAGLTTKSFLVSTDSDTYEEEDGAVIVKLLGGTGYSVGTNDRAVVSIKDDDAPANSPTISLSAITSAPIQEGEPARFRVTASIEPTSDLPVYIGVNESSDFISGIAGTRMVTIKSGERGKNFSINTVNDFTDEADGRISVTILDRTGYTLGSYITASVNVQDNDSPPFISILSTNSWAQSIEEGDIANFRVYSRNAVSTPINVNVLIEAEGNVLFKGDEIRTIEIPGGHSNKTLDIVTVDDEVAGSWGLIRATVITGNGYQVSSRDFSDSVKVLDNDSLPVVSISASESTITEGQTAEFELTSTAITVSDLFISVKLSGSSNFFAEELNNRIVTLPRGAKTVAFEINTVDDVNYELSGFIRAEVFTGGGYRVIDGSNNVKIISILDNDSTSMTKLMSVSAINQFGIPEGSPANFRLTSSSEFESTVMVDITISQQGNFVLGQDFDRTIEFASGTTTKDFAISTENDTIDEVDGSITVQLQSGQQYNISNYSTATIPIIDNDTPANGPKLSIYELTKTITEGETASFRFTSSFTPDQDLDVQLEIEQIGNFSMEQFGFRTLKISHHRLRRIPFVTFSLTTQNDAVTETTGSIIVTIKGGVGYHVGISRSAVVNILDNDKPIGTPTVSISTIHRAEITEGETAQFQLTSSASFDTDIDILVKLTGNMRFLQTDHDFNYGDFAREIWPVQLEAGETQAIFTVDTLDDSEYEPNGTITVTVQAWQNYKVGDQNSVTIAVRNNDAEPEISVFAESENGVAEGSPALFYLSSTTQIRRWAHLNVTILVSETGNYIDGDLGYRTLVTWDFSSILLTSSRPGRFFIDTLDDTIDEADGSITVTIIDGAGFTVGSSSSATVQIFDNDGKPSISIFPTTTEYIAEGDEAIFELRTAEVLENDLEVRVSLTIQKDFFGDLTNNSIEKVEIKAGTSSKELEIQTVDDEEKELNGRITATIQSNSNYDVGAFKSSTIVIVDDDEVAFSAPTISLESLSTSGIVEGQNARLKFSVAGTVSKETTIIYSVSSPSHIVTSSPIYKEFEISPNQTEMFINEPFADDQVDEPDGLVTFELYNAPEYNIGNNYRAQVEVRDNDLAPEISIASLSTNGVNESESARFRIHSPTASLNDLQIIVDISGTQDFLLNPQESRTIKLPSETREAFFDVTTIGNNINTSNGMVTTTIQMGTGYTVGSNNQANVMIMDDDPENPSIPLVSIESATNQPIIEGDLIRYKLTTTSVLSSDLEVNLQISGSADLIDNIGKRVVTIPQQMSEKVFELQTIEDNVSDENAGITLTIQVGEDYLVGENDNLTIRVKDDDEIPELSIISLANAPIFEGETLRFRITSISPSKKNIRIDYSVEDQRSFVVQPPNLWVLPAYTTSIEVNLETTNDLALDQEGAVIVTLNSTEDYTLSDTFRVSTNILDDESFPEFSIHVVGAESIMEGESINLKLVSENPSLLDTNVGIWLNGTIKFLQDRHRYRLITVEQGVREVFFSFEAFNDLVDRRNGRISVSLVNGEYYTLGQNKTAVIDIIDNDDAPLYSINPISVHGIEEGEPALFLLSTTIASSSNTEINLNVSSQGGYLNEGQDSMTVTFPAEQTEFVFSVDTIDNDQISESGSIQVSIQMSEEYKTEEPTMADVVVYDNEGPPVITINSGEIEEIHEGYSAAFFISSLLTTITDIEVNVEFQYQGEFFNELIPNRSITLPSGRKSQIYYVETIDDLVDEQDGQVTAVVKESTDYVIGEQDRATITIKDNDDLPTLSIHAENSYVEEKEGGEAVAQFNIWSTTISQVDMTINFSVKQSGGFSIWRAPKNITLIAGERTAIVSFPISDDKEYNPEAELTITLLPSSDSNYNLSTNNRATVKINDNDDEPDPKDLPTLPNNQPRISVASAVVNALTQELLSESTPLEISIAAESLTIEHSSSANFIISSNKVPATDQTINLRIERVNSEVSEISNESVVLSAGQNTVGYTVNTANSNFNYSNSTISVQVLAGPNYSVSRDLERSKASVTIIDSQEFASPNEEIIQAGEQIVDLMQNKINKSALNIIQQRNNNNSETNSPTSFALGGETNLKNFITKYGSMLNEDGSNWQTIFNKTAFEIKLNPNQYANQSAIVWGFGNNHELNNSLSSDLNTKTGNMFIWQSGIETNLQPDTQIGIATSFTDGTAKYQYSNLKESESATFEFQHVAVQPYLRSNFLRNSSIWLSSSYGTSTLKVSSEEFELELGKSNDFNVMIGGSNQLYSSADLWVNHVIDLGINWHGLWLKSFTQKANENEFSVSKRNTHFQLILDGDYQFKKTKKSVLGINFKLDTNVENQNKSLSNKANLSSGIKLSNHNNWSINGSGYSSLNFTGQKWGISGTLEKNNELESEGLKLKISTNWGYKYEDTCIIDFTSQCVAESNLGKRSSNDQHSFEGLIGYGLKSNKWDVIYTPTGSFEFLPSDGEKFELGHELKFESDFFIDIKATWKFLSFKPSEQSTIVHGGIKW